MQQAPRHSKNGHTYAPEQDGPAQFANDLRHQRYPFNSRFFVRLSMKMS